MPDNNIQQSMKEYECLRSEILKRMELKQQIIHFALIVIGATAALAFKEEGIEEILMLNPFLLFALAISWVHHDVRSGSIGSYIFYGIERKKLKHINWEHIIGEYPMGLIFGKIFIRFSEVIAIFLFSVVSLISAILAMALLWKEYDAWIYSICAIGFLLSFLSFFIIQSRKSLYRKKNIKQLAKSFEKSNNDIEFYCCFDGEKIKNAKINHPVFIHNKHMFERAYIFDKKIKNYFTKDGNLFHKSAGGIIEQEEDGIVKILLFRRNTYPIGYYTIPAGHIKINEDPKEAIIRECKEETGLDVVLREPVFFEGLIYDECRRGADFHNWTVYKCDCDGDGDIKCNEEGCDIGWYSKDQILNDLPLTLPTAYFLSIKFGQYPKHVWPE